MGIEVLIPAGQIDIHFEEEQDYHVVMPSTFLLQIIKDVLSGMEKGAVINQKQNSIV